MANVQDKLLANRAEKDQVSAALWEANAKQGEYKTAASSAEDARAALARSLATAQADLTRARATAAEAQHKAEQLSEALTKAQGELATETEQRKLLFTMSRTALKSFDDFLFPGSHNQGPSQRRFVEAASFLSSYKQAAEDAPPLWDIGLWDDAEPQRGTPDSPLSVLAIELFETLRPGRWDHVLLLRLARFTQLVAGAASAINLALVRAVLEKAVEAVECLAADTLDAAAVSCGLAICQALGVVAVRWRVKELGSATDAVARRLTTLLSGLPVVDLVVAARPVEDLSPLPVGRLSLLSARRCAVGFIVDAQARTIRVVRTERSVWDGPELLRVRGPPGEDDVVVPAASDESHEWLVWEWLA